MTNNPQKTEDWSAEEAPHANGLRKPVIEAQTVEEEKMLRELKIKEDDARAMRELRRDSANKIIRLFRSANIVILSAVVVAAAVDYVMIAAGAFEPSDRLIGNNVLMALIGATTVQLGAVMYTIYRYLFPTDENDGQ